MKGLKKLLPAAMCGMMALPLAGCGSSGGSADSEHTYTMWLYSAQDASYYTDYGENTALQYLLDKTWGENDEKIAFEFLVPPAGSQQNNYDTMITSGDYPDVLMAVVADPAGKMYESGMILDITDLVEQYMPNYYNYIKSDENLWNHATCEVDGEDRIMSIVSVYEDYPYYNFGMTYRRDWIVKYGKNPQTGAAFTGGYTDASDVDSWEDDVVFPSGGSDPVYISDWEWMFEIFKEAQNDLGIEDSYCTSIYYPGFTWSGGGYAPVLGRDCPSGTRRQTGACSSGETSLPCGLIWNV